MEIINVKGENKGHIMLYALSTCGWCKKCKKLLDDMKVEYNFIYVDQLEGEDRKEILKELEKYNPDKNFPTIVVNNDKCIIGFNEEELRKVLGK